MFTRPRTALAAATVLALAAAVGCQGGPPTLFGYQLGAAARYDPNIKTVYVPVSYNRAFQTTPNRGIEVDVTRAVVRALGAQTPFRVVSDPGEADTELLMNVVDIGKLQLNINPQNLTREAEVVLTVDVLWRDLRDGTILSAPRKRRPPGGDQPVPPELLQPFDNDVPLAPPAPVPQPALPIRLVSAGRMIPELGESYTTAQQMAVNRMAQQIVAMMEKPW